jgi:hypothetical protein
LRPAISDGRISRAKADKVIDALEEQIQQRARRSSPLRASEQDFARYLSRDLHQVWNARPGDYAKKRPNTRRSLAEMAPISGGRMQPCTACQRGAIDAARRAGYTCARRGTAENVRATRQKWIQMALTRCSVNFNIHGRPARNGFSHWHAYISSPRTLNAWSVWFNNYGRASGYMVSGVMPEEDRQNGQHRNGARHLDSQPRPLSSRQTRTARSAEL